VCFSFHHHPSILGLREVRQRQKLATAVSQTNRQFVEEGERFVQALMKLKSVEGPEVNGRVTTATSFCPQSPTLMPSKFVGNLQFTSKPQIEFPRKTN